MVQVTVPNLFYFDEIRKTKQLWPKNLSFEQFYK